MEQFSFFWFLLMQSSLFGAGLIAAALTGAVLFIRNRREMARLLVLPACWLIPVALAGALYEHHDLKSADWLQYAFYPMLFGYLGTAIGIVTTLPRQRKIAVVCALINAPFLFLAAMVVSMAGSGIWV